MGCGCCTEVGQSQAELPALRIALVLNAMMFVVGVVVGVWAQSTGILGDALDMLADASAYAIALLAVTRTMTFKRNAARWNGVALLLLGVSIVFESGRRFVVGSDPQASLMMAYSLVSLAVNVSVLRLLTRVQSGEIHLRATWICTRADVLANLGVLASGLLVWAFAARYPDLLIGALIGAYVAKEAWEILSEATRAGADSRVTP